MNVNSCNIQKVIVHAKYIFLFPCIISLFVFLGIFKIALEI